MARWLIGIGLGMALVISLVHWAFEHVRRRRARRPQAASAEILFFSRYAPRGGPAGPKSSSGRRNP
jgi:hypothetical protein